VAFQAPIYTFTAAVRQPRVLPCLCAQSITRVHYRHAVPPAHFVSSVESSKANPANEKNYEMRKSCYHERNLLNGSALGSYVVGGTKSKTKDE
jgi:hypothetical protein